MTKEQDLDRLAGDVRRLSRLLTKDRDSLPHAYLRDPGLRNAYVRYYLPANLGKVALPLAELALLPSRPLDRSELRVLDIGTGPGTALFGVLEYFSSREKRPALSFLAADHVEENLQEAARLFNERAQAYRGAASLRTMRLAVKDLAGAVKGRFDLIVLANMLNELYPAEPDRIQRRSGMLDTLLRRLLDERGSCIVIEPALKETSRDLLAVRDAMQGTGWTVCSPCLYAGSCPALADPRDWCHEERAWAPPDVVREVDRRIGLRKDSLKFSYLVLRRDGASLADVHGASAFRVVSELLVSKGKAELYLCGPGGRRLAVLLDKDANDGNGAFGSLRRGDVVSFDGLIDEEKRWKVGKETAVKLPG